MKPFFKWPGSKSWLINRLADLMPANLPRVVEPFAGSASFYLGGHFPSALLADTNKYIVMCLSAVRDDPKSVLLYLSKLKNCAEDYSRIRSEMPIEPVSAAGRLIFLANTSWGGLYRENLKGQFNVPFGNNGRLFFCEDTILSASERLKSSEIRQWDFSQTLAATKRDDWIFVDAPYVTKNNSEFFDRYHAIRFGWNDQILLAKSLNQREMRSRAILITCAANQDLYDLFPSWNVFEFDKRNSMTACLRAGGYRREALLISSSLGDFAGIIDDRGIGNCVRRV